MPLGGGVRGGRGGRAAAVGGHCPHPTSWGPWCQQVAAHRVGNAPCSAPCGHWGAINSAKYPWRGAHRTPHPEPTRDSPPSPQLLPVGAWAGVSIAHLHDELPRVGPGHGGALPRCQDPDGPDVQRRSPEIAAQDDTLCGHEPVGTPQSPPPQPPPSGPGLPAGSWQPQDPGVSGGGSIMPPKWVWVPAGHSLGCSPPGRYPQPPSRCWQGRCQRSG